MIVTEIYNGQGLGNQLACYVTTRVVALDKGYDFGIMNPHKFKCLDFMNLDFGLPVTGGSEKEGGPPDTLPDGIHNYFRERWNVLPNDANVTIDDPQLFQIPDNTKIDGIFQSETQIIHRKDEIKQWLKVKPEKDCFDYSDPNICVINYRGGEYTTMPWVLIRHEYWMNAIDKMKSINPDMKFVVITDDVETAKKQFPDFGVYHFDIGKDFSIIKNAHYLIISNSSFPIFAIMMNDNVKHIIAPKYWARHNVSDGYWSCGYNIYRNYNYLDRDGNFSTCDECVNEFSEYMKQHPTYW
jgi:hypothetical protein